MSNVTSTPQYFSPTTDITFDADTEYSKCESSQSTLVTVPAQQTPQELAEAKDLKGKIAVFLNKHLGKSSSKSRNIVQKLPTNDPRQLNNILQALIVLKRNPREFARTKAELSYETEFWQFFACGCIKDTTSEDRLTLRALALYYFAEIDARLYTQDAARYVNELQSSNVGLYDIKGLNHGVLTAELAAYKSNAKGSVGRTVWDARIAVLPTILSEMEKLYRD